MIIDAITLWLVGVIRKIDFLRRMVLAHSYGEVKSAFKIVIPVFT